MAASIYDVASKAGVSISTVSRAFTRPELVSSKTLDKVLAAANDLDYSITRAATTMKTGQSFRIALLLSDAASTWFNSSLIDGIDVVLHPAGYDFSIYRVTNIEERREFFSTLPVKKNVDAVITASFGLDAKESERLASIGVPIVGINPTSYEGLDASIGVDDRRAATLAADHLISLGHRRITYVRTNPVSSLHYSALQREEGFSDACDSSADPINLRIVTLSDGSDCIDLALTEILDGKAQPTAIACQEDNIAMRLLFRLRRYGLDVPKDISLTGFDDSTYAADAGLTTIHQDPTAMGSAAARKTLSLLAGNTPAPEHDIVPAHLVMRSSTAAPRA
ncbi:LacI family DNA-binding transcriptional regulator [Bifidobacterium scardovii]|uniref:Regulatory protein LacI n=1 Tax=Bifidobacterium scardovii TaxID=158787 RepID=A0A087D3K5_9BIFI|nr:LacI family DNA-binding transcriptional regulator [Bifidobacterium scardovii]KFI90105.1 regulatory protein LacI [Bifidobacterium scardovii]MDK6349217.1 LacI family DNA-binding transcriptional regulator [Bifidobacterium scardovii]MDU8980742.1 LacI family DNA-binding transcriptional regulator [Bifidobacterium scardovii]